MREKRKLWGLVIFVISNYYSLVKPLSKQEVGHFGPNLDKSRCLVLLFFHRSYCLDWSHKDIYILCCASIFWIPQVSGPKPIIQIGIRARFGWTFGGFVL